MADNDTATPSGGNTDSGPLFTPSERQYFESRGESPIPPDPKPEPQPEPQPQPDTPAQPQDTPPPPEESKTVPHGALAEERGRRKEAEERARQAELINARMEERFRAWQQHTAPRPQQPQRPPTPEEDIFGAVNHLAQQQAYTNMQINAYRQHEAAKAQVQQIANWANQAEAVFKEKTPDYDDALNHLRTSRVNELKAVYGMNNAAANAQLVNEERQLLVQAAQMRRNPAELAYLNAKQRGYQGKAAPDPSKQLDIIEAGQQASRSLSNVGGKAGGGVDVQLTDLLKMSDADFVAFKNKNPAKYRRLKGG